MSGTQNLVAFLAIGLIVVNFWVGWQRKALTGSLGI